jgi:aspartyl-tRNA(Asn)/glutamyl-tRNA(Gln) amidotransferase subunit A
MERALAPYDALLSPTVPMVAPALAEVAPGAERDDAFFRINALLLRNPSVVNMLDGCALSLPCHAEGELPVGLMLWHAALHDDSVLAIALQVERGLQATR